MLFKVGLLRDPKVLGNVPAGNGESSFDVDERGEAKRQPSRLGRPHTWTLHSGLPPLIPLGDAGCFHGL